MKTLLISMALAAIGLSGCSKLFHPPAPPSKEERQKEFIHCFREEMQPTDEQLKALQEKIFSDTGAVEAVAGDLKKATDLLEQGLESEMGEPELMKHFQRVGELKQKMGEDHFRRMLMLRSILTPAQRARFLVCKRKMGPPVLPHE